jgi:hypothetical protein
VILQECKSNYERWIAVVRDKRLELTSFTVSASSSIVNSPEKSKESPESNKGKGSENIITIQKGKEDQL